jgi:hypothetical protein
MERAKEDADDLEIKTSLEEPDMEKYLEEVMKEVQVSIKRK